MIHLETDLSSTEWMKNARTSFRGWIHTAVQ